MNALPAAVGEAPLQRVRARGVLAVKHCAGATRLDRLYQEGAAKIRMPARDGGPLEAILINTAGGLTGGDRIDWRVEAGAGTSVTVTTQACERIYRAGCGRAEANCSIHVAQGARVAWLPQETIVFNRSAFFRRLDVDLAQDAQALILEATLFGRHAMGERVDTALFRDRWRVRAGGRLVHAEDFSTGPDVAETMAGRAVAGGARAIATVLALAPDAGRWLEEARAIVGEAGGVSAWTVGGSGKLLARLIAEDGRRLRERLIPLASLLNGGAALPRVWSL